MVNKKYDWVVLIGRQRPQTKAHVELEKIAGKYGKMVLNLVGSADSAVSIKNMLDYPQTHTLIMNNTPDNLRGRLFVLPINDFLYKESLWNLEVQKTVDSAITKGDSVKLLGHYKDDTSYYLKNFPQWGDPIVVEEDFGGINATDVRYALLGDGIIQTEKLPRYTSLFLEKFKTTAQYQYLRDEYTYYKNYWDWLKTLPHYIPFTTTDAIVIKAGHVLLIRRKNHPGKGLLALPGGFLDKCTVEQNSIKELYEETNIDLPPAVVTGAKVDYHLFDSPGRSLRAHINTHTFVYNLDGRDKKEGFPKVKGGDDADWAGFVPLKDIKRNNVYEDHWHQLNFFGLVN